MATRDERFKMKARRWVFTWNNYTDINVQELVSLTAKDCDYIIFGFEKGDEGTKHIQGYVDFSCPLAGTTVKNRLDPIAKKASGISIDHAFKSREHNATYCSKEDTGDLEAIELYGVKFFELIFKEKKQGQRSDWHKMRDFIKDEPDFEKFADEYPEAAIKYQSGIKGMINGVVTAQFEEIAKNEFKDIKLQDWQEKLAKYLEYDPDPRKIIWIYDKTGNKGKTFMADYLSATRKAAIFENAATKDIAHAWKGENIVVFDFARTIETRLNYQIIESIKNGRVFSAKYDSTSKRFPKPHVVCFANWPPNCEAMSKDRWDIRCLDYLDKPEVLEVLEVNYPCNTVSQAKGTDMINNTKVIDDVRKADAIKKIERELDILLDDDNNINGVANCDSYINEMIMHVLDSPQGAAPAFMR